MKFKWFILLLLSFYLTSDQAFSQQTFQRAYGGSGNDYGKSVIQIYDGNYLIVGETTSSGAGVRDVFVMKIDTAGNLLWSNTYGGTGDEDLASGDLLQTADSGFIILGRTKSFGASGWDIYCVKLDSVGTIVWENRYGGNVTDNGDGIYPTHDGGYIITSSQTSYTVGSNDISLLKIDGSGNLKWTKTYGASSADHPGKIRRTSDSGFFIVGNTLSFGLGSRVAFLIRIDSLGNKLWHKVYNGGQDEGLMTLELTLDGGVIMLGSTKSGGAGNWDMFLIKADSAGNVLWAKSYGGSGIDRGIRIITEPNGDYTIAGHSESVGNGSRDLILMRIDSVGTAIWTRAYGTSQFEEAGWWSSMMAKTNDGGYIMTGTTTGFSNGDQEIYVVKTDKNGFAGCNEVCVTFTEGTPTIVATSPALSLDTTFARFSMSNVVSQFTLNDSLACFTNNAFKYDTTICLGASAQLITAGGDTYSWSPGGTLNDSTIVNPIATPSTTTVYVVLVTDTQCNAVDTGIFTVNVSVPPNFGLVDGTICIGDSITWTASGVQSYWWAELSKPNDTISVLAGLSVSPSVMTSYIITGTDSSSCTWKDTVTVDVNTLPIVNSSVTPDTVCLNDSSIFTATGAQSYTWAKLDSPAVTISILSSWQTTFDSTTSLIVTGTDTNNCVNYDTVTLVVNPLPLADSIIGSPFICPFDDSIDYSINIITVGSTYDWGVVNGTITYGQGTDSIKVAWDSTGSALVTCIETNFFGCVGDTLFFLVNINVLWTPPAPFGPDTLCAAESDSITYSAIFTFKANYYWHIQGGTILSGDSTWQVVVRWDTIGTG